MLLKIGQFILKLQAGAHRAQRQGLQIAEARREAEREMGREIRAETYRDYLMDKAKARKADETGSGKRQNGKVQPASASGQSRPVKVNQGSSREEGVPEARRSDAGAKTD
jgi:hypothetical protein